MRVAVYGNLIVDTLVDVERTINLGESHDCKVTNRLGGVINFCRAAQGLYDVSLRTAVGGDFTAYGEIPSPCDYVIRTMADAITSRAVVAVDRQRCSRTGFVEWGACRGNDLWTPVDDADWNHFMYLDRMTGVDLASYFGTVSVDMCDSVGVDALKGVLGHVDYLFVSEDEERPFRTRPPQVRKETIVHGPEAVYRLKPDGTVVDMYRIQKASNLNVVGAGDYFAAFCVANILNEADDVIVAASKSTLETLKRQS